MRKGRRGKLFFAFLCEFLCVLCVEIMVDYFIGAFGLADVPHIARDRYCAFRPPERDYC